MQNIYPEPEPRLCCFADSSTRIIACFSQHFLSGRQIFHIVSQPAFTCLNSTMKPPEQVKAIQS